MINMWYKDVRLWFLALFIIGCILIASFNGIT